MVELLELCGAYTNKRVHSSSLANNLQCEAVLLNIHENERLARYPHILNSSYATISRISRTAPNQHIPYTVIISSGLFSPAVIDPYFS